MREYRTHKLHTKEVLELHELTATSARQYTDYRLASPDHTATDKGSIMPAPILIVFT